jgi:predicted helicase
VSAPLVSRRRARGSCYRRDRRLAEALKAGKTVALRRASVESALWFRDGRRVRLPLNRSVASVRVNSNDTITRLKIWMDRRRVTHDGVAHFVAESGRAVFSNRMLIATTDRIHHIGERTMKEIEKPPLIVRLRDLEDAEVDWPTSVSDLRPAPPAEPKRPQPYQSSD